MEKFELKRGELQATFILPVVYHARKGMGASMNFRCNYPGMEPPMAGAALSEGDLNVCLRLGTSSGKAEALMAEAADFFQPQYPEQIFRAGTHGPYELLRSIQRYGTAEESEGLFYLFKGADGKMVGIEDRGPDALYASSAFAQPAFPVSTVAGNYQADRRMGTDLHVNYSIARKAGRDFMKIDSAIIRFIARYRRPG